MPDFTFQSITNTGEVRSGVLTGNDQADIVEQLSNRGETATQVNLIKQTRAKASGTAKRNRKMTKVEMSTMIRELATAQEAGLPLMQALRTIRKQASPASGEVLDHFIQGVEAGDPLYKVAAEWGDPFDDLIVGMLRAADASGQMSTILHQLADLMDRSLELKRELLGAILYPAIIAGLIAISGIVLVTVLVPRLIEPFVGKIVLPWPTVVVMGFADFLFNWWFWVVAAIGIIVVAWRSWISVKENRLWFDRFKLQMPLLGRLLRDVAVARFTRTLGTLTSAGLPILEGLRITRDTLGNTALAEAIDAVQDQVSSGKPIADPLEKSGLFPPLLVQVVNLGERSGKLEEMLLHSATAFDRHVNASLKLFTKALPPLLLIVMACLACFVLAAILLPLLELQSLVQ
ncbi:MAG: type II secretion system F family protein [Phycisphaerales bacterium]|nr:type II secretion system F family protein [Planctomycetota bacterium]MBL6997133.1 type II secretion system F family protein [Phycisphaerales bacterium]